MKFIESILFKDGSYNNLSLHQARIDRVFQQFSPEDQAYNLQQILPNLKKKGIYKVRMIYDVHSKGATYHLDFSAYHVRKIETLEVIHSPPFDYSLKYENRACIHNLVSKSTADDIIIALDNQVTDGSYFNLAFWDGQDWVTPNTPLLKGVRRTHLISQGLIKEKEILVTDLSSFSKVSLINAMLDLGDLELSISQIKI